MPLELVVRGQISFLPLHTKIDVFKTQDLLFRQSS